MSSTIPTPVSVTTTKMGTETGSTQAKTNTAMTMVGNKSLGLQQQHLHQQQKHQCPSAPMKQKLMLQPPSASSHTIATNVNKREKSKHQPIPRKFGEDTTNLIPKQTSMTATTSSSLSVSHRTKTAKKDKKEELKETARICQLALASLAPALEVESAISTTHLLERLQKQQTSQKMLKHPEQCQIDLAFHYTHLRNLEAIKEHGLMTKTERQTKSVDTLKNHGSMYKDGIYTGNNPLAFAYRRYGDRGIVLARLCGERRDSIERVHYENQIDKDFKSVIIGNKHLPHDPEGLFDEVVLQFGSQVAPLLTYSRRAVDPLVEGNDRNIQFLYFACNKLLESINSSWNTKAMGKVTISEYLSDYFIRKAIQFQPIIQKRYLRRSKDFEARSLSVAANQSQPQSSNAPAATIGSGSHATTTTKNNLNKNKGTKTAEALMHAQQVGLTATKVSPKTTKPQVTANPSSSKATSLAAAVIGQATSSTTPSLKAISERSSNALQDGSGTILSVKPENLQLVAAATAINSKHDKVDSTMATNASASNSQATTTSSSTIAVNLPMNKDEGLTTIHQHAPRSASNPSTSVDSTNTVLVPQNSSLIPNSNSNAQNPGPLPTLTKINMKGALVTVGPPSFKPSVVKWLRKSTRENVPAKTVVKNLPSTRSGCHPQKPPLYPSKPANKPNTTAPTAPSTSKQSLGLAKLPISLETKAIRDEASVTPRRTTCLAPTVLTPPLNRCPGSNRHSLLAAPVRPTTPKSHHASMDGSQEFFFTPPQSSEAQSESMTNGQSTLSANVGGGGRTKGYLNILQCSVKTLIISVFGYGFGSSNSN